MPDFRPGEIVLIGFPFTDAQGYKKRPALILLDAGDSDMVVARITSQAVQSSFDIQIENWREAGLLLPSIIRVHKVATLEKRLIERKLGTLMLGDWANVKAKVHELWAVM